jgi:hypothetical protein
LRHTKVHLRDHSLRGKLEETKGIIRGRKKGQVIQQPKEKKRQKDKNRSTNITHQTEYRAIRTPLKRLLQRR